MCGVERNADDDEYHAERNDGNEGFHVNERRTKLLLTARVNRDAKNEQHRSKNDDPDNEIHV